MICAWCGAGRERMAVFEHQSGATLSLCFHGCQHFPEPFAKTGLSDEWSRCDPWQNIKRGQPRLRAQPETARA